MKTIIKKTILASFTVLSMSFNSEALAQKTKVAVLNFDAKHIGYEPSQMGDLVRLELEKLDTFDVMDRYDVNYLVEKNKINVTNCYGKICLVEAGKSLGADKMLTGSVEAFGEVMIYTMRIIDVKNENIEATQVTEFLNNPKELQVMSAVMLKQLFKRNVDPAILSQLTKPDNYDARARQPITDQVRMDGPRMGATMFTGKTASIIQSPRSQGGYDAVPVMFQFGYQFEKQYLSSGSFQALFEFVPMVTGLDQGLFIPSFTLMNGLRENRLGVEFAFGPSVTLSTRAKGFYTEAGSWVTQSEFQSNPGLYGNISPSFVDRLDSRGDVHLSSSFIIAAGKTFRSGNLNIPVNVYFVPSGQGNRYGISFGYNIRNRKAKTQNDYRMK